jgi:hypothetical protein
LADFDKIVNNTLADFKIWISTEINNFMHNEMFTVFPSKERSKFVKKLNNLDLKIGEYLNSSNS